MTGKRRKKLSYVSRRTPRVRQAEALDRIKGRVGFALLMAMRTGKTKVIVDDWQRDICTFPNLLVIAPAGVYKTWVTAIKDDADEYLFSMMKIFVWDSKTKPDPDKFLAFKGPRVLLMNVEALSSVKAAQKLVIDFCKSGHTNVTIDESVVIKNHEAERTKFILTEIAPLAARRRIMSGLPTPKSPLDLFTQFFFVDPRILGFEDFYSFRFRYANLKKILSGKRFVTVVESYKNIDELHAKIEPHSFRVTLEDCYDLPPSTYMVREVTLTKEQARIYDDLKMFATAEIVKGKHVTAKAVITQLLRLHQCLCGHTRDEQDQWHEIPENRTRSLIELLSDHDGKAVIWCSYDADVRKVTAALQAHFGEGTVARFWGGNRDTREQEEARFKRDPTCLYMVATAAAGGRGRLWDVADLVVYYSNSPDLDHRMQSEERAKNVGKTRSIAYVDLVVPGTMDEKMLRALRKKIDMSSAITGDNWREWVV